MESSQALSKEATTTRRLLETNDRTNKLIVAKLKELHLANTAMHKAFDDLTQKCQGLEQKQQVAQQCIGSLIVRLETLEKKA